MEGRPFPQPIRGSEVEDLNPSLRFWIDHLRVERGLAENTLAAYRRDLTDLSTYCHSIDVHFPEKVRREHLQSYLKKLTEGGKSAHSRQRNLVAMRGFFKFLVREGRLEKNPTDLIQLPRKDRKLPHTLTVEQIEAIILAPGDAQRKSKTPLRPLSDPLRTPLEKK